MTAGPGIVTHVLQNIDPLLENVPCKNDNVARNNCKVHETDAANVQKTAEASMSGPPCRQKQQALYLSTPLAMYCSSGSEPASKYVVRSLL